MALLTAKISEMPLQLPPQFFSSYSAAPRKPCFSLSFLKPFCSSSLPPAGIPRKSLQNRDIVKPTTTEYSSSWLNKWPSQNPLPPVHYKNPKTIQPELEGTRVDDDSDPPRTSAIERIVLRLRNLGLGTDGDDEDDDIAEPGIGRGGDDVGWMNGEEKLGDLLRRDWEKKFGWLKEIEAVGFFVWLASNNVLSKFSVVGRDLGIQDGLTKIVEGTDWTYAIYWQVITSKSGKSALI